MNAEALKLAERLRDLGTFPGASERDLASIAASGQLVTVPKDWSLIWERTPADKAYVVLAGDVDVRRGGEVVARLGAGDVVGEVAIVEHRLRTASVVSTSRLEVLHFTSDAVHSLYDAVPAFREALDRAVVARA